MNEQLKAKIEEVAAYVRKGPRYNRLMKIKCTNVKYDLDGETSSPKLPRTVTVEVSDDMLECCIDSDGETDIDEISEIIEDAIEEKVGYTVISGDAALT